MDSARRIFIKNTSLVGLLVAAGFFGARQARAELWNQPAFNATSLEEALVNIVDGPLLESEDIKILAPDIAENGAVVPVEVVAAMDGVESIAILCEDNPNPLAAVYDIPEGTLPEIRTRVKMAGTSKVVVLVRAGGNFFRSSRHVKVIRGGCG